MSIPARERLASASAEGATTPETLRQKDRRDIRRSGKRMFAHPTDGVSRLRRRISQVPRQRGRNCLGRLSLSISENDSVLRRTPLYELHKELGAKMVPFAGYEMPVQYPAGVLQEHLHTRENAGLFDVSHMGQAQIFASISELEKTFPADLQSLKVGAQKYSFLLNEQAGILDDLMLTRMEDYFYLVVNASNKEEDFALLRKQLDVKQLPHQALLALQGPKAAQILGTMAPEIMDMKFMTGRNMHIRGIPVFITRSGYTGEDGYEISVPADQAVTFSKILLQNPNVKPVGLGARDSLRLEAGLCLHGNDIDPMTTPVEADLTWAIGKRRREEGGFPGAEVVQEQLRSGPKRKRVGIIPEGKAPARAHTEILDGDGLKIGEITSGGFGPSVNGPVAMGYVSSTHASPGTPVLLSVRGKNLPARIVTMPFVPHHYYR